VLWSGLYGATGRESAIVGALFAFWPLVLVVLVCHRPGRPQPRPVVRWAVGLIGGIAAVAVARTGALEPTIGPALVAVAIALPASLAVALLVDSLSPRAPIVGVTVTPFQRRRAPCVSPRLVPDCGRIPD
jgi:hypothetical protein